MSTETRSSFAALEEPGGVETFLLNSGNLSQLADVSEAAELIGLSSGEFASLSVRRFLDRASPDDWASLTSAINNGDDAMGSAIAVILRRAVADVKEVFE